MFQLKHLPHKGQKFKLFTAIAYALGSLLASGSAYAVSDSEFQKVKETVKKHHQVLVDLKDKTADQKAVEANKELIKATAEAVGETGALVTALTDKVVANEAEIAKKANQGYVDGMVKEIALRYDPVLEELHKNQLTAATETEAVKEETKQAVDTAKKVSVKLEGKADRSQVTELTNAVQADLTAVQNTLKTKANQADVEKVDERVSTVSTVVAAQQTAIHSLENRVAGLDNQIIGLNNKVDKLEENVETGLAIQSAQAALFQPYRIGRMNVTAGLGGYKGKTALAVGVGYRFNEQFAAKAGVAADTKGKGASYNLGVNFEF